MLEGLIPICSSCKKVRDESGCWSELAAYVLKRAEVEFSHGICPDCAKNLYPETFGPDSDGNPEK